MGNFVQEQLSAIAIFLFLRGAVVESLRAPGARTSARLASWIRDTPELKLNLLLLVEAFLQLLASGLGALAFVWATVVLLGGFSTMLGRMDFWFTTSIVFVEAARVVGYNSAPEARFFVDLPGALSQKDISRAGMASVKFVRILTMGPTWIALAPIFLATACMSLSIIGLVGIARHPYGGYANSGNLKPALILFYSLVLTQGTVFLLWFAVMVIRSWLAAKLSLSLCSERNSFREGRSSLRSGYQLIERYVSIIGGTCIEKGVATTINTNLVSFAAELLLQSQHPDNYTSAVSVLHSLVIENKERSGQAVEQICSSEKLVCRLVRMLRSEDLDVRIKEKIAAIVVQLACKLRLADIPGGARCISSLLDPHFPNEGIFVRGLVILGKLATDTENCTEIYSTVDLVPKVIAPIRNGLHMLIKEDVETVKLVRESLHVVAKLTRGIGECSTKLCRELTTKHGRTAENILWILSNSDDQDMRMLAVEILSRLTLDAPRTLQFTAELRCLLLDSQDSPLRIEAGKALIACGHEFTDVQQLVTIMSSDEYSKEYRAVTAEILAQICAKSTADQDRISRLTSVANALPTVLKSIVTVTMDIPEHCFFEQTDITENKRKFLASFLGLAVQIHEKLVTAEAFAVAVTGLPLGNNSFAETLRKIIQMTISRPPKRLQDEVFLAIIKSATKMVTWMTEIETINPYIDYFQRVNIVQKLDSAVMTMVLLERCVVMNGVADENHGYVTLRTLVETAKNKLVPQQQQQN